MRSAPASRHRILLIICDLAGTVVDYGSLAPVSAFYELFRRHGVKCTDAEIRAPMGRHKRDHIRAMLRQKEVAERWRIAHGRRWTEDDVERLFQEFVILQTACLLAHNQPIPGAIETVAKWRREGKKVAVTTGYSIDMTRMAIDDVAKNGLRFDCACCAEEVSAGRPAPWMIYRCMEKTGVYPPAAVVKIGDTIADIEEARNAGVWAVGVTRSGNMLGLSRDEDESLPTSERAERLRKAEAAMLEAGAHYVVESIGDCAAVIAEIDVLLVVPDKKAV